MILYILLIAFAGLMTLIAIGFLIGGLMKKRQKVWVGGLIGFVVFTLVTVFASYTYVKKSIDYMATDEFQEETRKKAENLGKTWGNTVSGTAEGLEATLDDEAIEKLANKGANIMGKGVKAFAAGMDESTGYTTVFVDESVDKLGISVGRAEKLVDSTDRSFGLFLTYNKDFEGTLVLTAYDSKGQKQDNAEISVNQRAGKALVHVFKFPYFEPGLSGYCILSKGT